MLAACVDEEERRGGEGGGSGDATLESMEQVVAAAVAVESALLATDSNATTSSSSNNINQIKCIKCSIRLKDVKLLRSHFWKVHISKRDIINAQQLINNNNNSNNSTSSAESSPTNGTNHNGSQLKRSSRAAATVASDADSVKKKKKKKTDSKSQETDDDHDSVDESDDDDDDDHHDGDDEQEDYANSNGNNANNKSGCGDDDENQQATDDDADADYGDYELDALASAESDFKYLNLSRGQIDEEQIARRVQAFHAANSTGEFYKMDELVPGEIVWAPWRTKGSTFMWPCVLQRLQRNLCVVRYYEMHQKKSCVFRIIANKCELFFRPDANTHFAIKEINAAYKPRYQFLVCYTDALKDFVAQLEAKEQKLKKKQQQQQQQPLALSPSNQCQDKENRPEAVAQATSLNTTTTKNGVEMSTATHQHHQTPTNKSYTVGGKRLTLDDVRALAKKAYSDEQEQVLRERDAYSKQLFERLDSPECKEFLIAVVEKQRPCKRSEVYLSSDRLKRKEMKFCSPGPLLVDEQQALVAILMDICATHFPDKPDHLTTYEYDVLYPEAVIWALMKSENLTYAKAERKYRMGFKRTDEEAIKQRCNEILNNLPTSNSANTSTITTTTSNTTNNRHEHLDVSTATCDESLATLHSFVAAKASANVAENETTMSDTNGDTSMSCPPEDANNKTNMSNDLTDSYTEEFKRAHETQATTAASAFAMAPPQPPLLASISPVKIADGAEHGQEKEQEQVASNDENNHLQEDVEQSITAMIDEVEQSINDGQ